MNSVFPGRTILLSIIGSTLLLYSCRSNQAEQLPVKGAALKGLNISEVKDQIALNLDDLFDSILFIPLETNKQVVLNGYRKDVLLNDDYIVVIEETAILQFDIKGNFLKTVLTRGRGPKEFNSIRSPRLTNGGLFYSDGQYRDRICYYEFASDSLISIPHIEGHISNLIVTDDRLLHYIWCSPFANDHFEATLYTQNQAGEIIGQHDLGQTHKSQGVLGYHKLFYRNNQTFISTPRMDTIWEVNSSELIPVWTTDIGPPSQPEIKTQTYYHAELVECSQANILFHLQGFKKQGKRNFGGRRELIFANKETQQVGKITGFTIDDFNITPNMVNIHSNSKKHIILEISAYAFIQEMGRQSLNHTGKYGKQLLDLMETMREDDNPLLIVGRIPAPVEIY